MSEDVVAVEHLDGAGGAAAGVLGDLDLGEAALADGLAELVRLGLLPRWRYGGGG